jgi:RimJ/RimL family protein N-acetyltransferase
VLVSLESFARRLNDCLVFGGFRDQGPPDQAPFGIVLFTREDGPKVAHKGHLLGLYVRPAARGTGLSGQLVQTLLDHAQGTVDLVQLRVSIENRAARRLFARHGFEPYGAERRAIKLGGDYVDAVHMVKLLD